MKNPAVVMVTIFKNHGIKAGTSIAHPHSQIIGSPTAPRNMRIQEDFSQAYFDDYGTCIYCDLLRRELYLTTILINQNRSFVAFVPYAAKVPYEIWILPRRLIPAGFELGSGFRINPSIPEKDAEILRCL